MTSCPARVVALTLALFLPRLIQAKVVVVLEDDQESYKQALAGVRDLVPGAKSIFLKDGTDSIGGGDVVVALGDKAAQADYQAGLPLVAALGLDPDTKILRPCVRVSPLPDGFVLLSKIHDLVPKLSALMIFDVKDHNRDFIKYLGAAGNVSTIKIESRSVNNAGDLVSGLRSLKGRCQALWLAPEASLLSQQSFKPISDFCLANKIALIAPVAVLAQVGAMAGVGPSYREQGREAGKAAASLAAGKTVPSTVSPSKCDTMIKVSVAEALGLAASASDGQLLP